MQARHLQRNTGFQAEVKQLLQLMIHSLYSNKEIFLRELISNASDACDRLRFEAMSRPQLLAGHSELGITVSFDKAARTITVSDNGIGMSRTDAIEHLGTIAKSGTREFFAQLSGDHQGRSRLVIWRRFYSSLSGRRVTVGSRALAKTFRTQFWRASAGIHEEPPNVPSGTRCHAAMRKGRTSFCQQQVESVISIPDHIFGRFASARKCGDRQERVSPDAS